MKNNIFLLITLLMALSLAACASGNNTETEAASPPKQDNMENQRESPEANEPLGNNSEVQLTAQSDNKILIAYFTRADNVDQQPDADAVSRATFNPGSNGILGNTEILARYINSAVGGDLFSIQATEPYPYDVDETIAEIHANGDPRTTLQTQIENMEDYDIVFIGFPIFNATMPQPVISFFETYNFTGKTIIPFSTHRGSRFGRSLSDLEALCPGAEIVNGFTVDGDSAINSQDDILNWLEEIGFKF